MKVKSSKIASSIIITLILLSIYPTAHSTAQSMPHLKDTIILSSKQKKTILLMSNEISRLSMENTFKDSIITTDKQRIEWYKTLDTIRCNQLAEANKDAANLRVKLKKERVKVVIWQVIAGLSLLSVLLI